MNWSAFVNKREGPFRLLLSHTLYSEITVTYSEITNCLFAIYENLSENPFYLHTILCLEPISSAHKCNHYAKLSAISTSFLATLILDFNTGLCCKSMQSNQFTLEINWK